MAGWAFLAGMLSMLALCIVLLPWLRSIGGFEPWLTRLRWPAAIVFVVVVSASLVGERWPAHRPATVPGPLIDRDLRAALASASSPPTASAPRTAASMNDAVASLEARLARGGGSDGDWELLAKSYEFLGRPDDAARAHAHQLPAVSAAPANATAANASPGSTPAARASLPASAPPVLSAESRQRLAEAGRERQAKHFKKAAEIYARLAAADQLDADGWADYADTAASLAGRKLDGVPERYVERALALDPDHPKALWLEASAQEEQGRLAQAISTWQRLAALLPPGSDDARIVAANLARDDALLPAASGAAAAVAVRGEPASLSAAPGRTVSGEVTLASALKSRILAGATLFIVARSVDAPGPPLAVLRRAAGEWPVKFTLDDSQAMLPGHTLSSAGRIEVEARVSSSGQAMPASGDLRGKSPTLSPVDRGAVRIAIDEVVP